MTDVLRSFDDENRIDIISNSHDRNSISNDI